MTLSQLYRTIKALLGKKPGTGEGQIFKEGIKTISFEVYRGISVLCIAQIEGDTLVYKYLFYTSVADGDSRREDTLHSGKASDIDSVKMLAYKAIDKIAD